MTTAGPTIALALEREDAVASLRALLGPHDPATAKQV
jgi:nucleoside diphosphate kinase